MGGDGGRKRARDDETDDEIVPNELLARRGCAAHTRLATKIGAALLKMDKGIDINYVSDGDTVSLWCTPESGVCVVQLAPLLRILDRFRLANRAQAARVRVSRMLPTPGAPDTKHFRVDVALGGAVPFEPAMDAPSADDLATVLCVDDSAVPVHSTAGKTARLAFEPALDTLSISALLVFRKHIAARRPMLDPATLELALDAVPGAS